MNGQNSRQQKLLQFFVTTFEQIYVIANRKFQSGRPPVDTDDSRVLVSSASSTASSAKAVISSDEFTGVGAFCVIFSRNMLNNTGDNGHPCHTPNLQHFHLVAHHLLLHRTTT